MPIAKPQAIEKILYHMANVENLTRRANIATDIYSRRMGQQRLPLYNESFLKDFDRVTGAINEGKLSNIAENLVTPEDFKMINDMYGKTGAYLLPENLSTSGRPAVALPESSVVEGYGPTNIAHEGRHLEVWQGMYGEKYRSPIFQVVGTPEDMSGRHVLLARNEPNAPSGKEVGRLKDLTAVHDELKDTEFDAAMSEMATMYKAGDFEQKLQYNYKSKYPASFTEPRKEAYKMLWKLLPPKAQQHFIETAALAGIATPSIGAFQPETKNK